MKNKLYCFDKLEELFSLYEKVRQAVVLSENFNKERKIHIAPINQMRSALDHIFKDLYQKLFPKFEKRNKTVFQ